jgi:hypothetical protein
VLLLVARGLSCLLAEIVGLNPAGRWMPVYCECCVLSVEVSVLSQSLVQGSPAKGMHVECDQV